MFSYIFVCKFIDEYLQSSGNRIRPLDFDGGFIDFGRDRQANDEDSVRPIASPNQGTNAVGTGGGGSDVIGDADRDRDRNRISADPGDCSRDGFETSFEKVVDYTYNQGSKEAITTSRDIGIIIQCLNECRDRGRDCLSVTLLNERGGRQRCFAIDASAGNDETDPNYEAGVTYFEKICVRKLILSFIFSSIKILFN